MRYLTPEQVLALHGLVISQSGGRPGVHDYGALESAVAQPAMTFDQADLYPTLAQKAAALTYSLIQNHPFIDGNKRVGHAAMETFLVLNGYELAALVDEQEEVIISLASSQMSREELADWIVSHLVGHEPESRA
jgi:death-on-curing protein